MSGTYEILDGDTVVNTIVADAEFMQAAYPQGNYRLVAEPAQPPEPEPAWKWCIDIGPFFDRFGAAKMPVLMSTDAGVQAILKDIQVRKWIDLRLPEVAQSLAYVGSKVPAVTPAMQGDIVTTVPAPTENLALRKLYFGA